MPEIKELGLQEEEKGGKVQGQRLYGENISENNHDNQMEKKFTHRSTKKNGILLVKKASSSQSQISQMNRSKALIHKITNMKDLDNIELKLPMIQCLLETQREI